MKLPDNTLRLSGKEQEYIGMSHEYFPFVHCLSVVVHGFPFIVCCRRNPHSGYALFPVVLDALHKVFLHHLFLDIQQTDGVFYPEEDVEVSSSCL